MVTPPAKRTPPSQLRNPTNQRPLPLGQHLLRPMHQQLARHPKPPTSILPHHLRMLTSPLLQARANSPNNQRRTQRSMGLARVRERMRTRRWSRWSGGDAGDQRRGAGMLSGVGMERAELMDICRRTGSVRTSKDGVRDRLRSTERPPRVGRVDSCKGVRRSEADETFWRRQVRRWTEGNGLYEPPADTKEQVERGRRGPNQVIYQVDYEYSQQYIQVQSVVDAKIQYRVCALSSFGVYMQQ
jgi:hypothetical protein